MKRKTQGADCLRCQRFNPFGQDATHSCLLGYGQFACLTEAGQVLIESAEQGCALLRSEVRFPVSALNFRSMRVDSATGVTSEARS